MPKPTNVYHLYFSRYIKLLIFLITAISALGLAVAIISMLFGKPIGDDYGAIAIYRDGNRLDEAIASLTSTGRYGQSIASSFFYGFLGDKVVTLLPLLTVIWFTAIVFLYTKFSLKSHIKNRQTLYLTAALISAILTFLVLFVNNTPQTTNLHAWVSYQLFFWPSGIITYTIPLLILGSGFYVLFLTNLKQRLSYRLRLILFAIVIFLTSLFNEVQPATILVISTGLLILSYLKPYTKLKEYRAIFISTIPVVILGLTTLFFSPGRIQRSQILDTITPSTEGSLVESILRNLSTLTTDLYFRPRELILLVLVGVIAAVTAFLFVKNRQTYLKKSRSLLPYIFVICIVSLVSIIISITLTVVGYGYSAGVYSRTMLFAQVSYAITIPLLVFSMSNLLLEARRARRIFAVGIVLLSFVFLASIPKYLDKILTQVNSSVTYYNIWLEQDAILKQAASDGVYNTVYLKDPAVGVGDGFSLTCSGPYAKSTMWLNVQISQYYGNNDRLCAVDKTTNQSEYNE